ncbi:MAG: YrhB domain-containing protein [Planctomycetota bacterium]|nr:YrhB domain-containing protein [Planctomycetota bacterium]
MITFDDAKRIALQKIGPDCGLVDEATREKPYGWYFNFQSIEYIRTGEFKRMLVGSGGFIVDREDGSVFEFGSAYSFERNLAAYEAGFKYKAYDLTILSVRDLRQTVDLLRRLRLRFVVPEEAHGNAWKIPTDYSAAQIKTALISLPVRFANQAFYFQFEVFLEIDRVRCFQYQLDGRRVGQPPTPIQPVKR